MTSTSVKDVGSAFANLYGSSVQSAVLPAGTPSFQQVLDSRVSGQEMQTAKGDAAEKSEVVVEKKTDTGKERPVEKQEEVTSTPDAEDSEDAELTAEELEAAMEMMSGAAAELMQKIADAFGISVEELEVAMDELGMTATDVLDSVKLGELILHLGGAGDSYALVTDEALYDNYRLLMGAREELLQELAKELGVEPDALNDIIAQSMQEEFGAAVEIPDELQNVEHDMEPESNPVGVTETAEEIQTVDSTEYAGADTAEEQSGEKKMQTDTVDGKQSAEFVNHNVATDDFRAQMQQTEGVYTGNAWDADTQNIMRQIMDYMKIQMDAETTSLEMQLHPASLGTVRVNIASNGGVVTASFIAQNEAVKAALESQMVQLRESFEQQGVKVEAIEVTVQTHQFEQNLEQGRGRNAQDSSTRRNRTRRINLNDPVSMENMEDEDVLAAEMLTAGGSTVDYTA